MSEKYRLKVITKKRVRRSSIPGYRRLVAVAAAFIVASAASLAQAQDATEPGFKSIFNGKDLSGWDGHPRLWSVRNGAITGQTTPGQPATNNTFLIWTNGTVGDFELRCSFKLVPNNSEGFANSGIQYRSKVLDRGYWVVGGYQADMEAGPNYTGILYEERLGRGIMAARGEKVVWGKDCKKQVAGSLGKSEELQAAIKKGDWNDYIVIAQGNHLQQFINGKQTVDVVDECESKHALTGILALQLHAGPPFTVQFKDLRIKKLVAEDAAAAELKRLQGTWQATGGEAQGGPMDENITRSLVLTITGTNYTVSSENGPDKGYFAVDVSKKPPQVDIYPESANGASIPAIYEVTEDKLRVCYGGPNTPRPTEFVTKADSKEFIINYKRKN
jgi:uncharacterized protein (TIGR03067 family)